MDTIEKEKQQRMIVQNLKGIDFVVKEAVKIKDAYREKMQELNMHGRSTYSQEYLEKEFQKVKSVHSAAMEAAYKDIADRLDQLLILIHDRDSVLDLGNPALTNALALIQTIGAAITYDQAVKINANFINDQSSLNAIRAAYQARGVVADGGINKLIYDSANKIDYLKKLAYQGLVQDGSINYFANDLAKLAALEGTTVEKLPDLQGADMAIRRAAGLSDK